MQKSPDEITVQAIIKSASLIDLFIMSQEESKRQAMRNFWIWGLVMVNRERLIQKLNTTITRIIRIMAASGAIVEKRLTEGEEKVCSRNMWRQIQKRYGSEPGGMKMIQRLERQSHTSRSRGRPAEKWWLNKLEGFYIATLLEGTDKDRLLRYAEELYGKDERLEEWIRWSKPTEPYSFRNLEEIFDPRALEQLFAKAKTDGLNAKELQDSLFGKGGILEQTTRVMMSQPAFRDVAVALESDRRKKKPETIVESILRTIVELGRRISDDAESKG